MAAIGQTRPTPGVNPTTIRTPLFILGVALALVAFLAMFAFGLLFANKTGSGAQTKLLVAARAINAREPMTADMVSLASWPQSGAPAQALTNASQLTGTSALVNIPAGQPITANVVASNPDQVTHSTFLPIPSGYIAIQVSGGELTGVGGYIAQGDYINVIAGVNTSILNPLVEHPQLVDRTVFTNVYVLRVGPQTAIPQQGQATGVASSLTILLTQCDALYLDWLTSNATIKYTLSSYQDYAKQPPQPTTACDPKVATSMSVGRTEIEGRWDFLKG